jgi:hypothetical protein
MDLQARHSASGAASQHGGRGGPPRLSDRAVTLRVREAVDATPVSAGADRSGVFGNEHGEGVAVERLEQMGDVAGVCDVVAGV